MIAKNDELIKFNEKLNKENKINNDEIEFLNLIKEGKYEKVKKQILKNKNFVNITDKVKLFNNQIIIFIILDAGNTITFCNKI